MASSLPYAIWSWRSVAMLEKVQEIVRDDSIDVVICDSVTPAVNVPAALPVPTILLQHEVEALAWHRRAALAADPLRRRYFQKQWYRMYAFERNQCRRFDHVISVSPEDLAWFSIEYGAAHVSSIPTGVDTVYFRPSLAARAAPMELVFTGSMDLAPNEDAASYFATEILPILSATASDVKLSIVGRDPTAGVQELARRDSRVHVTGRVADVRPYLERAAVVIAPLRIGGGTRPELLEAMAMEKPIVSTTIGVDGLPVRDGEHLLIADTPERFASAVKRLLDEPGFARELGRRAAALVRSEFTWSRVAARFAETCGQVIGDSASDAVVSTASVDRAQE
jgi:glycosyltransferase involved in cell wall biosynthesis